MEARTQVQLPVPVPAAPFRIYFHSLLAVYLEAEAEVALGETQWKQKAEVGTEAEIEAGIVIDLQAGFH